MVIFEYFKRNVRESVNKLKIFDTVQFYQDNDSKNGSDIVDILSALSSITKFECDWKFME